VCVLILYIKFYFGILGASKIITIISILFAIVLYFISVIALKIFTKEEIFMIPYGQRIYKTLVRLGVYKEKETA